MSSNETPPPPPPEEITPPQVVVSRRECGEMRADCVLLWFETSDSLLVNIISKLYSKEKLIAAIEVSLHIHYSSSTNSSVCVLLAK